MPPSPRAWPRASRAPLAAATCLVLSGCSLLVDFVTKDLPESSCDGGDCLDGSLYDAPPDTSPPPEAAPIGDGSNEKIANDVHVEAPQCPNPCRNRDNGWYCGNNGLFCNAPANDLYVCEMDAVADAMPCAHGCVPLPNSHPDTCDPCFGKVDGTYCGRDLPIVPHVPGSDRNDIYLFDCKGGQATTASQACPTNCTGAPPNGKCS